MTSNIRPLAVQLRPSMLRKVQPQSRQIPAHLAFLRIVFEFLYITML